MTVNGFSNKTNLIKSKVLEQRRPRWVCVENSQHLLACIRKQLLSVARVGDWFPLLCIAAWDLISKGCGESKKFVLQAYVTQVGIWNVAHENPPDFEHTFPLVRSPDSAAPCIVHGGQHFCHTAEVPTTTTISTTKTEAQR